MADVELLLTCEYPEVHVMFEYARKHHLVTFNKPGFVCIYARGNEAFLYIHDLNDKYRDDDANLVIDIPEDWYFKGAEKREPEEWD